MVDVVVVVLVDVVDVLGSVAPVPTVSGGASSVSADCEPLAAARGDAEREQQPDREGCDEQQGMRATRHGSGSELAGRSAPCGDRSSDSR